MNWLESKIHNIPHKKRRKQQLLPKILLVLNPESLKVNKSIPENFKNSCKKYKQLAELDSKKSEGYLTAN